MPKTRELAIVRNAEPTPKQEPKTLTPEEARTLVLFALSQALKRRKAIIEKYYARFAQGESLAYILESPDTEEALAAEAFARSFAHAEEYLASPETDLVETANKYSLRALRQITSLKPWKHTSTREMSSIIGRAQTKALCDELELWDEIKQALRYVPEFNDKVHPDLTDGGW